MEQPSGAGQAPSARLAPNPRFPPYLVLLRVGFTLTPGVTAGAVRSYRTISPLPQRQSGKPESGSPCQIANDREG
jgi:hypothetical protein